MRRVWIGCGSNLGDRAANLRRGLAGLRAAGLAVEACSPVYETEPQGPPQPAFLNQVVRARWDGDVEELLPVLKRIEGDAGRRPGPRWGPRPLDLDILLCGESGEEVVETERLVIPHPRLAERSFVLVPLADLDPDLRVPGTGRSVARLLADRADRHLVRKRHAGGDEGA